MTALAKKKTRSAGFDNGLEMVRVRYEYPTDGGATGSYDVLEADGELIVHGFLAVVKTAVTGSSSTIKLGTSGDDDALMSAAQAALGANTIHQSPLIEGTPNTRTIPLRLADGEKIIQKIGGAVITAGVVEYTFWIMRA